MGISALQVTLVCILIMTLVGVRYLSIALVQSAGITAGLLVICACIVLAHWLEPSTDS